MVSKQDGTVSVHGAEWQCLHIAKVHKLAHETQFSLIRQVRIGRVLNLDAQRVDKLLAKFLCTKPTTEGGRRWRRLATGTRPF